MHAVLAVLIKALHDKIRRGNGDRERKLRIIRRRQQRHHPRGGGAHHAQLINALRFQKGNGLAEALQRDIVVPVILFLRRHGQHVDPLSVQPFGSGGSHIVLRTVSQHGDDPAFALLGAGIPRAVKAVGPYPENLSFHVSSLHWIIRSTICRQPSLASFTMGKTG